MSDGEREVEGQIYFAEDTMYMACAIPNCLFEGCSASIRSPSRAASPSGLRAVLSVSALGGRPASPFSLKHGRPVSH